MNNPFLFRPRGSLQPAQRRGVLASSRMNPYPRPTEISSSHQSSSNTSVSGDPLPQDEVPQDHGLMLQRCYMSIQVNSRQLQSLRETVSGIGRQIETIITKLNEWERERFNLKDAHLEKPIRAEVAKAYVNSLQRQLSDEQLVNIVQTVLGDDISDKYKCDLVSGRCRDLMTTFRAEERRRIFGRAPCVNAKYKTTSSLADDLIKYFNAPSSTMIKKTYTRHLAILRLYIQVVPDAEKANMFFPGFRKWVSDSYSSDTITEGEYADVMAHDEQHDYMRHPTDLSEAELRVMTTVACDHEEQLETSVITEETEATADDP